MQTEQILAIAIKALDDGKAIDVRVIDVRGKTSIADYMVIASGTSDRHVKSLASHVVEDVKHQGMQPLGVEGELVGEWVLVDLIDIIVHVMQPRIREFYQLEKFWQADHSEPKLASA
ncbi:MAG: ribosome silencing factor [Gammaproteobacteria bacterium]|nr:ribosome silencing factor [Gammaproteobacteria bacterium]